MLARPQETLELSHPQHPKTDEVSVTCMTFQGNETTQMLVGTEEGNIYGANRYDRAGAKAGLLHNETYAAHSGPVFGIDYHPLAGSIDFSDLFLSCGVDWTVRLWRSKGASASGIASHRGSASASDASTTISPLHTFEEASDYVLDARWHPHHPALFGTVDAGSKFDVWNINADAEVPAVSTLVGGSGEGHGTTSSSAKGLNKLAWDRREGRNVAIGSSDGKVYIYDIGAMATPRETEWDILRGTLQGLANTDVVGR
jgi:dynein intermediate chain